MYSIIQTARERRGGGRLGKAGEEGTYYKTLCFKGKLTLGSLIKKKQNNISIIMHNSIIKMFSRY